MLTHLLHRQRWALFLVALLFGASSAHAAGDEVRHVRATALAKAGRCAEALGVLGEIAQPSAKHELLRGQCLLEAKDYAGATQSFEQAKALDARLAGVELHLAMARYHLGDLRGAQTALDAAAPSSQARAEFHLYRGLLLLQSAQAREAAEALDRARQLSPATVEPTASYYAGLAWAGADEQVRAEESLARVKQLAPGSVWDSEADRALGQLRGGAGAGSWAWLRVGVEYDDNVVLRGDAVQVPDEIGGSDDLRAVWQLHAGHELFRSKAWSGGVTGTYYGSAHFDLSEFDQHYPLLGVWLDRRLADATTLRFRYDAGHAWVDSDPFLWSHEASLALFHDWGAAGHSRVAFGGFHYDYLFEIGDVPDGPGAMGGFCADLTRPCGPPGIDESRERNRDGLGWLAGIDHGFRLGVLETEIDAGLRYTSYSARGSEYSYRGPELWLGSETALPFELLLRLYGAIAYHSYRHPSSYPDPPLAVGVQYDLDGANRRDRRLRAGVELERTLTDQLSLMLRYAWQDNHSNVAVFDYDREIWGVYVTYRFKR